MPTNDSYILAERPQERMAIAMRNFYELWQESGRGGLPSVAVCEEYINHFFQKEISSVVHETIRKIRDMRDTATDKLEHDAALQMMISSAVIESKLALRHL